MQDPSAIAYLSLEHETKSRYCRHELCYRRVHSALVLEIRVALVLRRIVLNSMRNGATSEDAVARLDRITDDGQTDRPYHQG